MKKISLLIVLISSVFVVSAQQSLLQSGPMVGYAEMEEALLWIQTKSAATVYAEYWPTDKPKEVRRTASYQTRADEAFTARLIADEVAPGQTYEYAMYINKKRLSFEYPTQFQTLTLWQYRTDPPAFSFLTGSCSYISEKAADRPGKPYGGEYQIFEHMAKHDANFMLWLGDNFYLREPDFNTQTGIFHRYTHGRSLKVLQPLLAKMHHYAIWDDHDFGPNDSDRSFWNKHKTREAFTLFWGNLNYGVGGTEGITGFFPWSDVDFFLLDNRWDRAPNKQKGTHKTLLGKKQLQWLKDALVSSRGSFKFIALGGQFLNDAPQYENYSNHGFAKERQEIIDFIYENDIKNVVFLTGDRHHTELSILEKGQAPRIVDVTVSPLTSGSARKVKDKNAHRVEGTLVTQRNFGKLTVTGPRKARVLRIEIFDNQGEKLWERSLESL